MSAPLPVIAADGRLHSLDQFRGYCVAGMLLVNFLAGLDVTPDVLEHHNTYFSYADSVLPAFLFAVGFAYRLTWSRRILRQDRAAVVAGYRRRSLALVMVSLILSGLGDGFSSWSSVDSSTWGLFFARLLKANLWEVLAIIGVTQMCLLPWIDRSFRTRAVAIPLLLLLHVIVSYFWNFAFVLGLPNFLDRLWGTDGVRCWDGGLFGIISWCSVVLAGTLACDLVGPISVSHGTIRRLLILGGACCCVGYLLNCVSCLYVMEGGSVPTRAFAESPVWPRASAFAERSLADLWADPPFVPVPASVPWNYWLMSKRLVSAPFVLFAIGFSYIVYAGFVWACDLRGWQSVILRTFGQNALLAYALHHLVLHVVKPFVPADSPTWYVLLMLILFVGWNYAVVRYFERRQIVLRL